LRQLGRVDCLTAAVLQPCFMRMLHACPKRATVRTVAEIIGHFDPHPQMRAGAGLIPQRRECVMSISEI
ncbi:hypothetical protein QN346_21460, partial [Undibacterium sp. 5I1]